MSDQEGDWNFYLRILSNSARDSTDPASDPSILQSLHGFCKLEKSSDDLVARIYPQINKVFQRSVASLSQSESGTAKALLLLERHRASPALNSALQAAASGPRSERMKRTLKIAPRLLDVYFSVTLRDANDSLICALIPLLMTRNSTMFPDRNFSHEIRWRLLEFVLAAFQRSL